MWADGNARSYEPIVKTQQSCWPSQYYIDSHGAAQTAEKDIEAVQTLGENLAFNIFNSSCDFISISMTYVNR